MSQAELVGGTVVKTMETKMTATKLPQADRFAFNYNSLRNIAAPEDLENDRRVYAGNAIATSFIKIPEDENVRSYIVTAEGKKRQRLTDVHRRIRSTLADTPENFVTLNSGIVIVARDIEIDEKSKTAFLVRPSIVNGSQTRGELEYYLANTPTDIRLNVSCKFEIVVTNDDDLIGEISIARNFQNDVATLSIVGRKGILDELEDRLQAAYPELKLRKSETQRSEDFYDTEKLLQVITALVPPSIWPKIAETDDPKKVFTYSMKAKCLKMFQELHKKAHDNSTNSGAEKDLYNFFLDIVPEAHRIYSLWKSHPGFKGTGIRAIQRDGTDIVDVPDGIIFPIIASLSAFGKKVNGKWTIVPPLIFTEKEIIEAAKGLYMNVAHSNPWNMGKSQAVYSALLQITKIYRKVAA